MSQNTKIPIIFNALNLPEVIGKVNGVGVRLIIDTGFSWPLALEISATQKFKVINDDEKVAKGFMFNAVKSDMVVGKIERLSLGSFLVTGIAAVLMDTSHFNKGLIQAGSQPVDGLIGGAFLREFRAIFDYDRKILNLFEGAV